MTSVTSAATGTRIASLDAFRGITIIMMIFVNNPGSWNHMYAPLQHSEWNGWTMTDTIFPFFIFIMGVSITLAFSKKIQAGIEKPQLYKEIFSRSCKLFILGLLLNLLSIDLFTPGHDWIADTLFKVRVMGILQRLSLVYALGSLLFLNVSRNTLITICITTLCLYWLVMLYAPFSIVINNNTLDLTGSLEHGKNFAAWIDHLVFGPSHVYFTKDVLIPYDPEGLLSTLTSIVSCLIGVLTGMYLQNNKPAPVKMATLFFTGVLFILAAQLMDAGFPINKTIWSPSYVVLMAGLALIFLTACMYLFDRKKPGYVAKFLNVFGMNAIFFFVASGILARVILMIRVDNTRLRDWLYNQYFFPLFGGKFGSMMFSVAFLLVFYAVLVWMYKKKIFLKL